MNLGDLPKVWEIKTLKRKPKEEESRKILDKIAKQVQPIMRNHKWRVKVLSEMCPKNPALLGLNVGAGVHVKLRLRRANRDDDFLPYHEVLDTMLHELCHNKHGPHNASFYKLWDELRKECEDLINQGISGSGQGFDLPGKRLGGDSRKFPLSALRKATSSAAENRARKATLLPSGPHKVGGDNSIMTALTPIQAAAMAAERRYLDNIWCGSEVCIDLSEEEEEHDENIEPLPNSSGNGCCSGISRPKDFDGQDLKLKSGKRKSDDASSMPSSDGQKKPVIVDLVGAIDCLDEEPPIKGRRKDSCKEASTSTSTYSRGQNDMWQCAACTLLNPPLAPICELCTNTKPKDENLKYFSWSCKFCTLENDMEMEKCSACETWRYSYGSPVASSAPNYGT